MNTIDTSLFGHLKPSARENLFTVMLHPRTLPSQNKMAARTLPLWELLSDAEVNELQIVYSLRQAKDVTVQMNIFTQCGAAWDQRAPSLRKLPTKDWALALQHAARLALPDCITAVGEPDHDPGTSIVLSRPAWDPMSAIANREHQLDLRPKAHQPPTAPALLLPHQSPMQLALDEVLLAATEIGVDLDLTLVLRKRPLAAAQLRTLGETTRRLLERLHAAGPDPFTRQRLLGALSRVESFAAAGMTIAIEARLRVLSERDRALAATLSPLLFGAADFGETDLVRAEGFSPCDLSDRILPADPKPALVPTPGCLPSLVRSARKNRRPSGGPRMDIGLDEAGERVGISLSDLEQHAYLIGASGTGKSTLMASMIRADIRAGRGVFLIDPHGELYVEVRDGLSPQERERTILADVSDLDNPFTLNLLETAGPHLHVQRNFICNQLIALFKEIYGSNKEAFGPMFEMYYRNALLLLMHGQYGPASLADFDRVFVDPQFRRALLDRCDDEHVVRFWQRTAVRAGGEASLENVTPYIISKNTQIAGNALVRPIICSPTSSLDIPEALRAGRVVLVNLARGIAGAPDAALLGGIITIRLFAAAMSRICVPAAKRSITRVYLDEFPAFASHILGEMIAEVRKFRLSLVLANQSLGQIDRRGADIAHAILANASSVMSFRLGPGDARAIAQWFGPEINELTLTRLPNHCCVARILEAGIPAEPRHVRIHGPSDLSGPDC